MQASDWAGAIGETWAEEWVRTDRTFATVDAALVAAIAARPAGIDAPRILDVGCGAGRTSLSLADTLPAAQLTGIDLSPALIGPTAVAMSTADDLERDRLRVGLDSLVRDHLTDGRTVFPAAAWIWSVTA